MMKEKKINRKKTHKEERRDLSLSLLASFFTTRLSRLFSELFGFVCSKHSIKVYISYHLHDDRERERERERENNKEREKRERGNLSSLSLFVNPKSNPLTFCALDGSLTAANPGVPFK